MEWLVRFAVVNILAELHFVAGGHRQPRFSWLRLEVRFEALRLAGNPRPNMIDDVLRLVSLVHITQESQFTLSILRVAVVEIDQELLKQ